MQCPVRVMGGWVPGDGCACGEGQAQYCDGTEELKAQLKAQRRGVLNSSACTTWHLALPEAQSRDGAMSRM